ncbi:MAG: YdcF family protein [bacterium]|nr:YdcF family protein [bacterium]
MTKTRFARITHRLSLAAIIALIIMAFTPLGHLILLPLEERIKRPLNIENMKAPDGIVVLGGSIDTIVTKARGTIAINESGERLTQIVELARRFPKARIVFSGGSGKIFSKNMSEADAALSFFLQMGLQPDRLVFEDKSQNTWQNARYTKDLLNPSPGERWLLVTSAFHMPRSLGCFRNVGMKIIPWPVDYRTRGASDLYRFFDRASEGWKRVDIGVREWVGLLVYRLSGRIDSFFPRQAAKSSLTVAN